MISLNINIITELEYEFVVLIVYRNHFLHFLLFALFLLFVMFTSFTLFTLFTFFFFFRLFWLLCVFDCDLVNIFFNLFSQLSFW
jgi:hypothetical protein